MPGTMLLLEPLIQRISWILYSGGKNGTKNRKRKVRR